MKKSILSAVLCFCIAYLKACDKGGGLSPCICGNCDPELPLGMGRAFRNSPQAETVSQISAPEWDAVSRSGLKRKLHPGMSARNGMNFPNATRMRKLCPGMSARNGMHFPVEASAESASQNSGSERDTLSGWHVWRKLRPSFWLQNGIHFPERSTCGGVSPLFVRRLSNYVIVSYIIGMYNIASYT